MIFQNENAKPGHLAWMRGIVRDGPLKCLTLPIFDRVAEISESGEYQPLMITEFVPHQKINSVPADKTPFRRDSPGNGIAVLHWSTNTPENVEQAKRYTAELAELVKTPGVAYGNYSKASVDPHTFIADNTLFQALTTTH